MYPIISEVRTRLVSDGCPSVREIPRRCLGYKLRKLKAMLLPLQQYERLWRAPLTRWGLILRGCPPLAIQSDNQQTRQQMETDPWKSRDVFFTLPCFRHVGFYSGDYGDWPTTWRRRNGVSRRRISLAPLNLSSLHCGAGITRIFLPKIWNGSVADGQTLKKSIFSFSVSYPNEIMGTPHLSDTASFPRFSTVSRGSVRTCK